jgi:CRISPR-associated endonuclease/helicase Cas3
MLDVANVARLLIERCLPDGLREKISRSLGLASANLAAPLALVAGLHDLGKCSPAFQRKSWALAEAVEKVGLPFPAIPAGGGASHAWMTANELPHALSAAGDAWWDSSCPAAELASRAAGAHHGTFPRSEDLENPSVRGRPAVGDHHWREARGELARLMTGFIDAGTRDWAIKCDAEADPVALPLLAGLISVADWIGSSSDHFPLHNPGSPEEYARKSRARAEEALTAIGWLPPVETASLLPFERIFGFPANALQASVANIALEQQQPYLLIIEAPMGIGKTEAALYAADSALCRRLARGLYVAMPTQATSNAMYVRVRDDYLRQQIHTGNLSVQLVHGNARLVDEYQDFNVLPIYGQAGNNEDPVSARGWFTARKRPLLAPFGVGTIDQSLLSVLQTRHWFVRLLGLANKVVVFDEVHAYDTYTSTILERLIRWLAALDCTVIVLSATLPSVRRQALIDAYRGSVGGAVPTANYPRVTRVSSGDARVTEVPVDELSRRTVHMRCQNPSLDSVVCALRRALSHSGCAAVICNTVARSQQVFQAVRAELQEYPSILFHARMPFGWRRERERRVLGLFGKRGDRPERAILVATQVIEQSLDLDFDWMASEMAPTDLLLQRMGRLWRHEGTRRPTTMNGPEFCLLGEGDRRGPPPDFGDSERVYERYVLLRSWLALRGRGEVRLPEEIERLVESVYCDEEPAPADDSWATALAESRQAMLRAREDAERKASKLLVAEPGDPARMLEEFSLELSEDDDPMVHPTIQAATRLGPPSVQVVCLCETPNGFSLPGDGSRPVSLNYEPDAAQTRDLLDASLPLSHRGLFHTLRSQASPGSWCRNPHLRFHRVITFREGSAPVGGYQLHLDSELGLVIDKEEP